jgi:small GTP-binding protein
LSFVIWDVGGQDMIRKLWRYYYQGTDAVIFVVDANDVSRLSIAKQELDVLLEAEELRDACVLVWANKQDLPGACSAAQVMEALELMKQRSRVFNVQACQATSGFGLYEGLDWLKNALERRDAQKYN